jgi:CcmD family protein
MTTAERYVTAAYCVIFALVLVYVVIIALKLTRLEREVDALAPQQSEVEREVAGLALGPGETAVDG